jgi:hypothetical protein
MSILLISLLMVTKTTTLAPPSLSTVLKSNTIQSAPAAASTPDATSNASSARFGDNPYDQYTENK